MLSNERSILTHYCLSLDCLRTFDRCIGTGPGGIEVLRAHLHTYVKLSTGAGITRVWRSG